MKKLLFILIIFFFILLFVFIYLVSLKINKQNNSYFQIFGKKLVDKIPSPIREGINQKFIDERKFCQIDTDCIAVATSCCGPCPDTSINKDYIEIFNKEKREKCGDAYACPTIGCGLTNHFPKCANNQCVFKEVDHSSFTPEECMALLNENEEYSCLNTVAKIKKDVEICKLISKKQWQDNCILSIAGKSRNSAACENIEDAWLLDICYFDSAVNNKNIEMCLKISREEKRSRCIYQIVVKNPDVDPANCQLATYIMDEHHNTQDSCFNDVALRDNNPNLCTDSLLYGNHCKAVLLKDSNYCTQIPQLYKGLIEDCYEKAQ